MAQFSTDLMLKKNVMPSAADAEICGTYKSMHNTLPIQVTLDKLGHTQPVTPIQLDNSMATSFANTEVKQR